MITQKISAWGNSLGVRLPQAIVQQVGWKEGAIVSITIKDNKVVLSTAKPTYTLDELLKNATPEMQHDEVDWGELGEESW